jgi:hypothetical protein
MYIDSFIKALLFAALQCTRMLKDRCILRQNLEILSPKLVQFFQQKMAKQGDKLTPRQVQKLKLFHCRAFVLAKLLRKKSLQPCQMKISPDMLCHLMTMGIPRQIMIIPIVNPRVCRIQVICDFFRVNNRIDLVVRDPIGDQYSVKTAYQLRIGILTCNQSRSAVHLSRHPTKNFIVMISKGGNVWIQNLDDPNNLFHLIHDAKLSQIDRAYTSEFHHSKLIIAIGVIGFINIIEFSPSLNTFTLIKKIPFGEEPTKFDRFTLHFCVNQIQWHKNETCFTAISHSGSRGLAKSFLLDDELNVRYHGKCTYNSSSVKVIAPSCIFLSNDGDFAVTGYQTGELFFWKVNNQNNELTFEILKSECMLAEGCTIKKIQFFQQDDSIFAIQTSSKSGASDDVYIVKISKSFDVVILCVFRVARHFDIFGDFLLIQFRSFIAIYILNSDNFPVKMTCFESKDEQIGSCLLTTENGKFMLYYSFVEKTELHKAALEFK